MSTSAEMGSGKMKQYPEGRLSFSLTLNPLKSVEESSNCKIQKEMK